MGAVIQQRMPEPFRDIRRGAHAAPSSKIRRLLQWKTSKDNRPLGTPEDFKPPTAGAIKCQEFRGGLLKHYYRDAA